MLQDFGLGVDHLVSPHPHFPFYSYAFTTLMIFFSSRSLKRFITVFIVIHSIYFVLLVPDDLITRATVIMTRSFLSHSKWRPEAIGFADSTWYTVNIFWAAIVIILVSQSLHILFLDTKSSVFQSTVVYSSKKIFLNKFLRPFCHFSNIQTLR